MVVLDEYKQKIQEQKSLLQEAGASLKPDELKSELKELQDQMSAPDFWNDIDSANKINQRAKLVENKLKRYEKLVSAAEDLDTLVEMAEEENDDSLVEELKTDLSSFTEKVQALRLSLFSGR